MLASDRVGYAVGRQEQQIDFGFQVERLELSREGEREREREREMVEGR